MRLAYETCDPCFFWYGDGHGSVHPDLIDPITTTSTSNSTADSTTEKKKKGDCLSWEVFTDEDAAEDSLDHEFGCRVWVERVEHDLWNVDHAMEELRLDSSESESERVEGEQEMKMNVGKKVLNWREALEPINRPCDFWGSFEVKSTGKKEARHASV
jgi:hypothetical protein